MESIAIALLTVALIIQAVFLLVTLAAIRKRIIELGPPTEPTVYMVLTSHQTDSVLRTHRRTMTLNAGPMLLMLAALSILLR